MSSGVFGESRGEGNREKDKGGGQDEGKVNEINRLKEISSVKERNDRGGRGEEQCNEKQ